MSSVTSLNTSSFGGKGPLVALVGCGDWGKNIARALSSLGALAAIVEHHKERGERYAQEFSCPLMSFEEALKSSSIHGVVLATSLESHKALAHAAMEAGKSVFIEKPVVATVKDFEDLILKATRQGVCLMGGHLLLYHPLFQEVCRLVGEGQVGEVRLVTSHRQNFGKFFPQEDVVWDFGPHDLSMICAVLQASNHELQEAHIRKSCLLETKGQADVASITLSLPNKCKGYAYLSRVSLTKEQRLVVWGTEGCLTFDDTLPWDQKLKFTPIKEGKNPAERLAGESSFIEIPPGEPLKAEMQAFLEGMKGADMTANHRNINQVLSILQKI